MRSSLIGISKRTYYKKEPKKELHRTVSQPRKLQQPSIDRNYILRSLGKKPVNTYYQESLAHYAPSTRKPVAEQDQGYGFGLKKYPTTANIALGSARKTVTEMESLSPTKFKASGKTTLTHTRNNSMTIQ